jgi:hypothetical protein
LIKVLKGLLGKISRKQPAKKTAPIARPQRPNNIGNFHAVEIAPSIKCCTAAMHAKGKRFLLREAPRLPLEACTMPTKCLCKFRKNADRRDTDRRLFGSTESKRWFAGVESRTRSARRSAQQ